MPHSNDAEERIKFCAYKVKPVFMAFQPWDEDTELDFQRFRAAIRAAEDRGYERGLQDRVEAVNRGMIDADKEIYTVAFAEGELKGAEAVEKNLPHQNSDQENCPCCSAANQVVTQIRNRK